MYKSEKKLDLVLTVDYELYGDGSGDVFDTMIKPTATFLSICKKHEITSTIFVEILEYLRIKKEWDGGNSMGYLSDPAEAIKKQIITAYQQGHDIQLHLHPHWLNAGYIDGKWVLDDRYWKISQVPPHADKDYSLGVEELIKLGKEAIEEILKPIDPSYKCNIFRAGGFSITPSNNVVDALKNQGFAADSSVIPGAYMDSFYCSFDFRSADKQLPFWGVKERVEATPSPINGFIEIPIFAKKMRRFLKYDPQRLKIGWNNKSANAIKIKSKVQSRNSLKDKLSYFMEEEYVTWDFCLFSLRKMEKYLREARKISVKNDFDFHPFVLIGHSKEFLLPHTFENFLNKNISHLNFLTLKNIVERLT